MSKKSRTKPIMLKGSDVANMVDAVFIGAQDDPGWVEMYADAKGRECVNALFPKAHIAWADDCGEMLPREWRAFTINLPDVVAAGTVSTTGAADDKPDPATASQAAQKQ